MKSSTSALLCIIIGLLTILLVNLTLLHHFYKTYEDDYQRKEDLFFNSTHDMLLQHKIMLSALRSLFNASDIVTKEEFNIFSEELLKIKSAVAFTLDDNYQVKYISDPVFLSEILAGKVQLNKDDKLEYQMKNFSSIIVSIEQQQMPYLVYAISHQGVQKRLDEYKGVCARLTLDGTEFNNAYCNKEAANWVTSFLKYQGTDTIDLPEYNKQYSISAWSIAPAVQTYELYLLVFFITAMGGSLSALLYLKIRNHTRLIQMTIETKSKFALLSSINHEIRTPINAVLGYSQMLKDSDYCDVSGRKTLDKIIWSANLLNSVAENTLNFSKAEAGHLSLDYRDVHFMDELNAIDDYYNDFSQTHEKRLVMQVQADMPEHIGLDSTKFFQLTTNFINNAFKYSNSSEVVFDISLKSVSGQHFVRVAIKDTGKGMSVESKKAITHPFNTDPNVKPAIQSGIGIGLYTCKKVIEEVGGSIRIRSKENKGTLVLFRFPYRQASEMAYSKKKIELHANPSGPWTDISLLLVDDDEFNLQICGSVLKACGFVVRALQDEDQAFKAFKASQPQVVVMDYRLAKADGISLIGEMQQVQTGEVHYFILSANDKSEIPNADAYPDITFLQKPLNLAVFMQQLDLRVA
ncbi:hybrid sensor histidine kinase/response regulator [Shewanella psychropiezotolerans]|uniref:histidine kinase n=1 Tax=Shewanella psychropiezotolerans TaxID=2593655 RepID=A0ABX5WXD8_9GAMM|nr:MULTISPECIES: hybrid sensor histidine kinase/response regulator [Shewanella]MPY26582.1 hybrid sensor histidine kinase/response regulator [Shewanella sp. YLB-07]QDO83755.1 hybrid sensor histidine kinase/response regulator [Shewanella psychropiezotolerans]